VGIADLHYVFSVVINTIILGIIHKAEFFALYLKVLLYGKFIIDLCALQVKWHLLKVRIAGSQYGFLFAYCRKYH